MVFPPLVLVDTVNYNTTVHYPGTGGPHGPPDVSFISLEYRIHESVFEFSHIGLTSCRRC
jgi:hypothetical protein